MTSASKSRPVRVKPPKEKERPFISIDPAMCFGQPCIHGSRLPAEQFASMWWDGWPLEEIEKGWPDYDFGWAEAIKVCCYYMGLHGSRTWKKRYGEYARSYNWTSWPMPPQNDTTEGPPTTQPP